MNKLWYFLTIFLDVYPWIFLQYLPFKNKLRLPYPMAIAVCTAVLLPYQLGFCFASERFLFNSNIMLLYRLFQFVLLILLTVFLIKDSIAKVLFVFGLMYPCVMFILSLAGYIKTYVPTELPVYMQTSLLRAGLSLFLFPFLLWFWKKILSQGMNMKDDSIWNYLLTIPAVFTLVSIFYTGNDFETAGVELSEVLARFVLFDGVIAVSFITFRLPGKEEQRVRAEEEAEKSRLLLSQQEQQYTLLAAGIEKARRDRHDLHHHIRVLHTLLESGDITELEQYLADLDGSYQSILPEVICQHPSVNAIVSYYKEMAKEVADIALFLQIDRDIGIEAMDLCIIIGNLLENAIEACGRMKRKCNRKISMKSRQQDGLLYLIISNTCEDTQTYTVILSGDIDGDGMVTVSDVVSLRQRIVGGQWTTEELCAADFDQSGTLSVSDVVDLRRQIVNGNQKD
ncbi:MAG: GHKL domain-containing protein [Candidatus Howiella sp.]|jgi:two-component system sensor histidine kinase AgrC